MVSVLWKCVLWTACRVCAAEQQQNIRCWDVNCWNGLNRCDKWNVNSSLDLTADFHFGDISRSEALGPNPRECAVRGDVEWWLSVEKGGGHSARCGDRGTQLNVVGVYIEKTKTAETHSKFMENESTLWFRGSEYSGSSWNDSGALELSVCGDIWWSKDIGIGSLHKMWSYFRWTFVPNVSAIDQSECLDVLR